MVEWGNPHFPLRGLLGRGVLCKLAPVPLDPGVFVVGGCGPTRYRQPLPATSASGSLLDCVYTGVLCLARGRAPVIYGPVGTLTYRVRGQG